MASEPSPETDTQPVDLAAGDVEHRIVRSKRRERFGRLCVVIVVVAVRRGFERRALGNQRHRPEHDAIERRLLPIAPRADVQHRAEQHRHEPEQQVEVEVARHPLRVVHDHVDADHAVDDRRDHARGPAEEREHDQPQRQVPLQPGAMDVDERAVRGQQVVQVERQPRPLHERPVRRPHRLDRDRPGALRHAESAAHRHTQGVLELVGEFGRQRRAAFDRHFARVNGPARRGHHVVRAVDRSVGGCVHPARRVGAEDGVRRPLGALDVAHASAERDGGPRGHARDADRDGLVVQADARSDPNVHAEPGGSVSRSARRMLTKAA